MALVLSKFKDSLFRLGPLILLIYICISEFHTQFYYWAIFSFNLQFGLGTMENASLSQSSQFISLIGTKNKTFNEYKNELQKIGSKIEVYSNSNYFGFQVSGFDKYYQSRRL